MNKLYLVRHGENPANLTKEFSSRKIDYPLTPKGRLQAEQTAAYFRGKEIHEIYASSLKRAVETAGIIALDLDLETTVMDNFRELDVGDLEEHPDLEEAWRIHFSVIQSWLDGSPETRFPGGENYYIAARRMREGVEHILAGKTERNIIIVGHGGIFAASAIDLCPGIDLKMLKMENHNCSISEMDMSLNNGFWSGELVRWADFSHLHGRAAELVSGLP
jgi:probable phosphoglycerate mutase